MVSKSEFFRAFVCLGNVGGDGRGGGGFHKISNEEYALSYSAPPVVVHV